MGGGGGGSRPRRSGGLQRGEMSGPHCPPAVLMVHGLAAAMNPAKLFNLICMYGDVNKVSQDWWNWSNTVSQQGGCLTKIVKRDGGVIKLVNIR